VDVSEVADRAHGSALEVVGLDARQRLPDGVGAVGPVADQNEAFMMSSASANTSLHNEYPWVFQTSRTITRFGDAALLEGKVDKVAVWGADLGWIDIMLETFVDRAPDHGLEVVMNERHSRDLRDFSSLILNAQDSGAEALVQGGYPPHAIASLRDISGSNWRPKHASFGSFEAKNTALEAGENLAHKRGSYAIWDENLETNGNSLMKEYFSKHAPEDESPSGQTALAWSNMQTIQKAISELGNDIYDDAATRKFFQDTDPIDTVIGPSEWNEDGGQTGVEWYIGQWQYNDEDELYLPFVYPDRVQQAEYQFPIEASEWES